ncbi:MAG: hypothetical protein IPL75_15915 [Acidobacteria bacterium]|nr:hypothetical protein [Acidobacteriota bacterium]
MTNDLRGPASSHQRPLRSFSTRGALRYLRPYRPQLAVVLVISLVSTGLSLWMPYLTKDLVDEALIGRNSAALFRIVILFAIIGAIGFVLNVASGLIYTRVSADILFDMRRELYEHLQRPLLVSTP